MNLKTWLETSLRDILEPVPQNPTHHAEGNVFRHSQMVRRQLNDAITYFQKLVGSSPVFSNFDPNFSKEEINILRIGALLHDIGKASATTNVDGAIKSIGHENPEHFEPMMQKLGSPWKEIFEKTSPQDKETLWYIIKNHMSFKHAFNKRILLQYLDENGKFKNDRNIKLLIVLIMMDQSGRIKIGELNGKEALPQIGDKMHQSTTDWFAKRKLTQNKSVSFAGSPEDFVKKLQSKSKDDKIKALKGKYPNLTDDQIDQLTETFRGFFEATEMQPKPTIMKAQIPLGKDENNIRILSKVLQQNDPDVHIYVVGGAVRDYLSHIQRQESGTNYKPKDIDLTTNLSEEEILERLQSPYAAQQGISVKEKTSVDTFGVVFATVNKENYELAPFRKDVGGSDGRRPDSVERGTIYDDAMRRDLTINNLYYDFNKGEILDFNPGGQGIKDIQNKNVRCVGDPNERFAEDKLRILRMVRFFSRVNPGDMKNSLDAQHVAAIERFKSLQGITPERIEGELLAGIKQSLNTSGFLKSLADLDLMQRIFPNLQVDIQGINRLGNLKNEKVILAWLLRSNKNIQNSLNSLKYPNEISEPVQFLINAMQMSHENAHETIKKRDSRLLKGKVYGPKTLKNRYNVGPNGEKEPITYGQNNAILQPHEMEELNQETTQTTQQDLNDMARVSGDPNIANRLNHFGSYQTPPIDSSALIAQGLKGPEIGAMQKQQTNAHYHQSFQDYINQRNAEKDKSEAF